MKRLAWVFLILSALAVIHLDRPAAADVVEFKTGAKTFGTVRGLTFVVAGGKEKFLDRDEIKALELGDKGLDHVVTSAGASLIGQVKQVDLEVSGGLVQLARADLAAVRLQDQTVNVKLEEYEKRRAKLQDRDAVGHYELGLWCRKEGLTDQMKACLQKSLEIDPRHRFANEARAVLEPGGDPGKAPTKTKQPAGPVKYHGKEYPPEVVKALKKIESQIVARARARDKELAAELDQEIEGLKKQYKREYDKAARKRDRVKKQIEDLRNQEKDARGRDATRGGDGDFSLTDREYTLDGLRRPDDYRRRRQDLERRELAPAEKECKRIQRETRARVLKVRRRHDARRDELRKVMRKLLSTVRQGKPISNDEIKQAIDKAGAKRKKDG